MKIERAMALNSAVVLVCLVLPGLSLGDATLEIATQSGKVRGLIKTTLDGIEVDTFLGIPYAVPPTDGNRFGPPKEVEAWSETMDATVSPRPCYQVIDPKWRGSAVVSSLQNTEDCLKLNIWVPKIRPGKSAVLVWIYGGAFTSGSIDLALYDGSILAAQEDVIVVSVNYRLSGFGFLYLEHPLAPGNAGLLDQALGLQWVKKNIEAFGGDPERVTLFGQSAGGASVGMHLLAPSSSDLFKNAILQSGTGVNTFATFTKEKALAQSLSFAEKSGCPVQENRREETIRCLQGLSGDKLYSIMMGLEDKGIIMDFRPVVDGKFLPRHPSDLLSDGRFSVEKNVLIGYTKEDGSSVLSTYASHLEINEDSLYSEEQILQVMSIFTNKKETVSGMKLDLVKYVYTDWNNTEDRISARSLMVHFLTDRWYACPALETASKMADRGNKVFLYRFDQIPTTPILHKLPKWMGSSHGTEVGYVFGQMTNDKGSVDAKVSKQMMRYWANFAKNGDPNDDYLPTWPQYDTKNKSMMKLDGKALTVEKNDRLRECAFWEHIYPKTQTSHEYDL